MVLSFHFFPLHPAPGRRQPSWRVWQNAILVIYLPTAVRTNLEALFRPFLPFFLRLPIL